MKTPHFQTRIYMTESTFSIDFYEDYRNHNYINELLEGIEESKRMFEIKMLHVELRLTAFYFTQCSKCNFSILTNRDQGYKINCQNCNHEGKTFAINRPEFDPLLEEIHGKLRKGKLVNLKGNILLLIIQPNNSNHSEDIIRLCKKDGLEIIELKDSYYMFSMLLMQGFQRGILSYEKPILFFKRVCEDEVFVGSEETPPFIDKLIRKIRRSGTDIMSLSMNIDPTEKDFLSLFLQGNLVEIENVQRKKLQKNPSNIDDLMFFSFILEKNGKLNEAKDKILMVLSFDPDNSEAWRQLGSIELLLGNYSEAIGKLEKSLEIDPLNRLAVLEMANCYRRMGRLDLASKLEVRLQNLGGLSFSSDLLLLSSDNSLMLNTKDTQNSSNKKGVSLTFDDGLMLSTKDAQESYNNGVSLIRSERFEEAIDSFDHSLKINPRLAHAWSSKGYALENLGQLGEAIESYDRALRLNSDLAQSWSGKGNALSRIGQHTKAINCHDKALKLDPKRALFWVNKGEALIGIGQNEKAIFCCDHALKLDPQFEKAWYLKILSLARIGRVEDSLQILKKLLSVEPKNEMAKHARERFLKILRRE